MLSFHRFTKRVCQYIFYPVTVATKCIGHAEQVYLFSILRLPDREEFNLRGYTLKGLPLTPVPN